MTVKELMNTLAQFDENMEVKIMDGDWAEDIEDVDDYDGIIIIQNIGI